MEGLLAGKLDVGILRVPTPHAPNVALQTIASERFIAVSPKDHRLARSRMLRLADLANEQFMAFPPERIPGLHTKFLLACDEAGFNPHIVLEAWQMASMVSLVAAGVGVVLLPEQVRGGSHPGVVYKHLSDKSEHLSLKIAAAWCPDRLSSGGKAVLSTLEDVRL